MNTIWDVLRRLVSSKPMNEAEQALAHQVIADHEAASAAPAADETPAETDPAAADVG